MPLGIAQEAATPSCSSRRSQCRRRALCSWTTKRGAPFFLRRFFAAGSGVLLKSRLRSYSSGTPITSHTAAEVLRPLGVEAAAEGERGRGELLLAAADRRFQRRRLAL